jgi:hypothetical protein
MMKKIFCLGLILSGAAAAVPALAAPSVGFETGIVAGLNLSRFGGKDTSLGYKMKPGFVGGFLFSITFGDYFALQPGILYSQKGAILSEETDQGTLRTTMAVSYVDIPLVARLGIPFGEENSTRVYALGGLSLSLKLKGHVMVDLVQDDFPSPLEDTPIEGFKSVGFNAVVGGGFDFAVKGGRLFFEGRYSHSLQTLSSEGFDYRFSVLSITAGFSF